MVWLLRIISFVICYIKMSPWTVFLNHNNWHYHVLFHSDIIYHNIWWLLHALCSLGMGISTEEQRGWIKSWVGLGSVVRWLWINIFIIIIVHMFWFIYIGRLYCGCACWDACFRNSCCTCAFRGLYCVISTQTWTMWQTLPNRIFSPLRLQARHCNGK